MKKRRVRRVVVLVLIVVLLGPLLIAFGGSWGRMYEVGDVPAQDVAIVFGAGLQPDGSPSAYLAARLDLAMELYRAGKVRVLLVSGSNPEKSYNEPAAMRTYLVAHGIPEDKVVADYAGADTYGTCVRAIRIFGVSKAILVSQGYHLPRAITTCRLVGVDAVGVGDQTVREQWDDLWQKFSLREIPAYYKMAWDVTTHRSPILGPPESSVREALGR